MAEVIDNHVRHRYEMEVGGAVAFVDYRLGDNFVALTHTEVPDALSGRGVGSRIARAVLEDLRSRSLLVVPECEFIAAFIARHPDYDSLVTR